MVFEGRQLSRRRLFRAAAWGGTAAAAATSFACGGTRRQSSVGGSAATSSQAAGQPKRGGSVTFAGGMAGSYDLQGRSFDPAIQTQFGAKSYSLFYERLLAYNLKSYAVEPELASNRLSVPNVRQKPMDDQRVTRALRLLVDHDEFVKAWADVQYGRGGYGSIFPAALSDWDLTENEYRQHLEWKQPKDDAAKEAISLLTAAGFTKENPLKFTLIGNSGNVTQAGTELLQAQWKRLSQGVVDAQIRLLDTPTLDQLRARADFAYGWLGHSTGGVEPDIWLTSTYHSNGSLNFMGYSDATLDAMIDKQRAIFDETQRKAAVKQIVLYMIDHGPTTITTERYFLDGVQPQVQNHVPEYYLNGHLYESVWLRA